MTKRQRAERADKLAAQQQEEKEKAHQHRRRYRRFRRKLRDNRVRYMQIPETLLPYLRPDCLTAAALRVFLHLHLYANDGGEYWKPIEHMAVDLNLDVRTVQRGLEQLRKRGLVWPARFSQNRYSRYFLLPFGPQAQNLDDDD